MYKIEKLIGGNFGSVGMLFYSEEDMLEMAKKLVHSGFTNIFACYPDGQKLRYPEEIVCRRK